MAPATRPAIWTIGHSNRDLGAFLALLDAHGIDVLVDVRSVPHSRRFPHFGRAALRAPLAESGIDYRWRGDLLGARHEDPALLDASGAVDFVRVARWPPFRRGLSTVLREARSGARVALCCAEKDPIDCHRAVLVGRHLAGRAELRHVIDATRTETQEEFEERVLRRAKIPQDPLFRDRAERLEQAWRAIGRRIAWRPDR